MRNRLVLIAVPLCTVMLAAGVAVASPNGGEHFNDTKLDDPHVVRPIAASARTGGAHALDVIYMEQVNAAAVAVALSQPPAPAPEPEPEPEPVRWTPAPVVQAQSSGNNGDFFSCVRQRESGGDYTIVSSNGLYHGAYQFLPSTWNSIASATGREDLVGIDPAAASPADQDAMAQALYAQSGSRPWGGYCG